MNEYAFYGEVRSKLFRGKLSTGAYNTIKEILEECRERKVYDYRHQAYILSTCYWESYSYAKNPDWNPVREGFATTNQGAINAVTALYKAGKVKSNYALPQSNGKSYYGRGYTQISLPDNYKQAGDYYGIPLYDNPDLALQRPIATLLLVGGIMEGWWTGKKLTDYITTTNTDFLGARRTVNGTDKAKEIEKIAMIFYSAMILL